MTWTNRFRNFNQKNKDRYINRRAESSKVFNRLQRIKDKPFWIEDPIKHEQLWAFEPNQCCFNHIIGLPVKDGEEKPIFDYEIELFKYLEKGKTDNRYKHLWIKKARGLGITEFFLRYMGYLALSSDLYQGKRFVVIPGTRVKIAWDLIRRMKHMFADYILEQSHYRLDMLMLNGVTVEAFPSNPESLRGYEDYKFILMDEADYFDPADQEELLPAVRGFIAKTNPYIIMVSTPHEPNSLFHRIEQMKSDEEAGFIRLHYLYPRGIGKIYQEAELEKEKQQPHFKREYEGQYAYGVGTLFNEPQILECERLGRESDSRIQHMRSSIRDATRKSLGIDIGYGSSRTAFVLTEYVDGIIRVVVSEQFTRPDFDAVVRRAYDLVREYSLDNGTNKVFVDGSAPEFIKSFKRIVGNEDPEYINLIALAKQSETELYYLMNIVPVNFSQRNQAMLDNTKKIVDSHVLAINPDASQGHQDLLTDLRVAKNKPDSFKLDKSAENKMDLFDALRLSLEYYK